MLIKPENLREIPPSDVNPLIKAAEEKLQQLACRTEAYLLVFKEMFSNPSELHQPDFVSLELLGHEVEVQAMQAKDAITALSNSNPAKAQELKALYDANLGGVHQEISSLSTPVLAELRAEIHRKFKELGESQSMNPTAVLAFQHSVQQFNLIVKKVEQEIQRIQFQRLF